MISKCRPKNVYYVDYSNIDSILGIRKPMDIPLGSIFEVTINSNKLYAYIEDILTHLRDHADKINDLTLTVADISTSLREQLKEQIKSKDYNIDIELQKMRKGNQEELNYVKLYMRDVDKKATDKLSEIEGITTLLNNKINKVKQNMQDQLAVKLSYIDKRLNSISTLHEEHQRSKQEIVQLRETLTDTNFKIEKLAVSLESESKRNKELNEELIERINQTERDFKNQAEQIHSMKHSMVEDNSPILKKRRHREKRDTHFYSNIINKIDEVEHSFVRDIQEHDKSGHHPRRSNIANSKIVKSNTNINQVQKSHFAVKSVGKFKEFQNLVMQKLAKIQSLSVQKFDSFSSQITKVINKNDIVDEHIGILSRKIDKEKYKIIEVTQNMKRYDDKRIDERTIQNLKNMIKKLSKDIEEMLDSKVSKEVYEKERQKIVQKMQFLNEFIIEKAEKTEVKKGLAFLEEKIKEIIIVLAEERGSTTDGALKKAPYKCLSCDKDLEIDRSEAQPRLTPKESVANLTRCSTNQLRKRIRMFNNTITSNINED